MKFRKLFLIGGMALLLFASAAHAVLDVTFSETLQINRIHYYWSGDANDPLTTGRMINPDETISFVLSDPNRQAKANATPPTDVYVFGSDAGYPNSSTIKIRVWDRVIYFQ
jgi:hypothetical protein